MLTIFRSTQAYAGLPFLFYALLLQLPAFFAPPVGVDAGGGHGYLALELLGWLERYPWVAVTLPVLLMAVQAVQASTLTNRHNFTRTATQLPALGVLLVWGLTPGLRTLHPGLLANCFLFSALLAVAGVYKNAYPQVNIFNAGFWLGLATLFEPAYLIFAVPLYIASGSLWRAELASLPRLFAGVGSVYLLVGAVAYFYGDGEAFLAGALPKLATGMEATGAFGLIYVALLTALALLLVTRFGKLIRPINIEGSKGVSFLYWLLLFTPVVVLFSAGISSVDTHVVIPCLGMLLGLWLNILPSRIAELIHLLLFAASMVLAASGTLVLLD